MNDSKNSIVIVGAGPSGLMAAIVAAENSANVAVYERQSFSCRKLRASGGGRCNITNTLNINDFSSHFGRQGRFVIPALKHFDNTALRVFLEKLGIKTFSPDGFYIFPVSEKASDIADALIRKCRELAVEIILDNPVISLSIKDKKVSGVVTASGERLLKSAVILAAGGMSYPSLGGTDSGYALAVQAGHSIINPVPALVEISASNPWIGSCAGVSLGKVSIRTDVAKFKNESVEGALLFTHNGISGPAALNISGTVSRLLEDHAGVDLTLNFFPGLSFSDFVSIIDKWQKHEPKKNLINLMSLYLPRSIVEIILSESGIDFSLKVSNLSRVKKESLSRNATGLNVAATGTAGFAKAMATRGGVALKDVNPETLESRIVRGLYFTGELLDIDGPCGGFNLQWAFSSGYLAGKSAIL